MTKRIFCFILAALMSALALTSCGGKNDTPKDSGNVSLDSGAPSHEEVITPDPYAPVSNITITLSGNSITPSEENPGIFVNGSTLTLRAGGTYTLVGDLDDGEIIVEAAKTDEVELILSGITVTNTKGAPLYIKSCDKIKITLADGTVNTLTDGAKYDLPTGEDKPNACLYSSEDMDFEGNGTLIVNGNYNNGIGCKNDIDIESGAIEVSAPNNAIKGNDSVSILGGMVKITAADDGIKADTEDNPEKGFVSIVGGKVEITCDDDAIQAFTSVSITGGEIITNAGGKSVNCDGNITLAEGILTEN